MSDRKCLRFFYDAFENGIESLDARYAQEPSTRFPGMMRTRLSMFSTGKLRCKFVEARFAGWVPGRYFTNHLQTFIP